MKVISMRGRQINMAALIARHPETKAIGNASMNARGDIIKGGKIVKPREQIAMEYHESNPKAVKSMGLAALSGEMFESPAAAVAAAREAAKQARAATPAPVPPVTNQQSGAVPIAKKRKLIEDDASDI